MAALGRTTILEAPSLKRGAIESLFDRLVDETKTEVRDSTERLFERGAIDRQQKESVIKALSQHHLETDYAASLLFQLVMTNVERDDRHFDRLLLALRDLELDKLADELLQASVAMPHQTDSDLEQSMEHDGGNTTSSTLPTRNQSKKMGAREKMSLDDSGIVQQSYSVSSQIISPDDYPNHGQPKLEVNSPTLTSPVHQLFLSSNEHDSENEPATSSPESTTVELPQIHDVSMVPTSDAQTSLFPVPQLQEPEDHEEDCDEREPIQANNDQSASVLVVSSQSEYSTTTLEGIGGSSDMLVDQLSHRLTQMHLELQNKERELRARTQEMQQNSDLLIRCQKLEEHVKRMEEEVRSQKLRADKISNEKDIEINAWKKQCEERECEIQMLRVTIARQEKEKRELAKAHMSEIRKLRQRQNESSRQIAEYEEKVEVLDSALKVATQKKEEAEQKLKEAGCRIKEAEAERYMAVIKLLENMCAKEKELSQLKEANLRLEIEIKELENQNQCLVVKTKEQEVLLHQKDKELAEHKQAAAEEKHNT